MALLLLLPCFAAGQTYQTDSGHAEFTGHTPLFSFKGSSDSLSGSVDIADSTVQFTLPVKTLDTGNNKRDRDMMNVLEANKFPNATFEGKITSSFNPDKLSKQEVTVKGTFTIHGVSQSLEIPVPYSLMIINSKLRPRGNKNLPLTIWNLPASFFTVWMTK